MSGSIQGQQTPTSIIDTGTTLIILPIPQFLVACLSIRGAFIAPQGTSLACAVNGPAPSNVKVAFGGTSYTLSPESLTLATDGATTYLGIFGQFLRASTTPLDLR